MNHLYMIQHDYSRYLTFQCKGTTIYWTPYLSFTYSMILVKVNVSFLTPTKLFLAYLANNMNFMHVNSNTTDRVSKLCRVLWEKEQYRHLMVWSMVADLILWGSTFLLSFESFLVSWNNWVIFVLPYSLAFLSSINST